MKIEIEELTPYLPYKLNFLYIADNEVYELNALYDNGDAFNWDLGEVDLELIKPILRPLSDLESGMFDEEAEYLIGRIIKGHTIHYGSLSYTFIQYLSKNHYDFQNLIMKGLAVDINEI